MPSFRHTTILSLNSEIALTEAALDSVPEREVEPLLAKLAELHKHYDALVAAAGLLRQVPASLFPRMTLKCLATGEPRLYLAPENAAEAVSFFELLPPLHLGSTAASKAAPRFGPDPAGYRTFPYITQVALAGRPLCWFNWYVGEVDCVLKIQLSLPREWAEAVYVRDTREITPVLVEGFVPYQHFTRDAHNSVLLYFPSAHHPQTGQLLTWRDVPVLRMMDAIGEADPCLLRNRPKDNPAIPPAEAATCAPLAPASSPILCKADTYASLYNQKGLTGLGTFSFKKMPLKREDILSHAQYATWLQGRLKERNFSVQQLLGITVQTEADEVFNVGSGEIDWERREQNVSE